MRFLSFLFVLTLIFLSSSPIAIQERSEYGIEEIADLSIHTPHQHVKIQMAVGSIIPVISKNNFRTKLFYHSTYQPAPSSKLFLSHCVLII